MRKQKIIFFCIILFCLAPLFLRAWCTGRLTLKPPICHDDHAKLVDAARKCILLPLPPDRCNVEVDYQGLLKALKEGSNKPDEGKDYTLPNQSFNPAYGNNWNDAIYDAYPKEIPRGAPLNAGTALDEINDLITELLT